MMIRRMTQCLDITQSPDYHLAWERSMIELLFFIKASGETLKAGDTITFEEEVDLLDWQGVVIWERND